MNDRLAVTKRTALRMFWEAGCDTEEALQRADNLLRGLAQPCAGYYFADEVVGLIEAGHPHHPARESAIAAVEESRDAAREPATLAN